MERLPAELRQAIFKHCDHPSLLALRLANRYFHNETTPLAFERFWMSLSVRDLHRLDRVANSKLGRHIRHFTFYANELPTHISLPFKDLLLVMLCNHEVASGRRNSLSRSTLVAELQGLDDVRLDQKDWFIGHHEHKFKELFSRLPSLKEVQLSTSFSPRQMSKFRTYSTILKDRKIWPGICRQNELRPLAYSAVCLLEAISFRESFAGTAFVESITIPTIVQDAAREAIGGTTHSRRSEPFAPGQPKAQVVDAFRNLAKLDFRFSYIGSLDRRPLRPGYADEATQMARSVAGFLQAAAQLHTLCLQFDSASDVQVCPALVETIAAQADNNGSFLPRLHSLKLSGRLGLYHVRGLVCFTANRLRELRLVLEKDSADAEHIAQSMSECLPWAKVSLRENEEDGEGMD